ncbi:multidrug resistance efflux transporter family protein [Stigmatella sp. ncwal1]|uniref:Multidrug resistance efflux transporter family protein n=1 Tax=Stigmatella ashevillensis TaxID=2995309 RepID=A0ABT5DCE8_9BACT|nr:multidrug resistance efflux transporter family protein [Stigmatella ashevillena]MDC0710709.1 multidrug resistance efflux transporter family protein [Stigmatella ashevillena]
MPPEHTPEPQRPSSLWPLLSLGLLAAVFFSLTFVLNRSMSLAGGHWVWSASLRYAAMLLLLSGYVFLRRGGAWMAATLRLFFQRPGFWLVAGSVGCGVFYGSVCFAAGHAPGWVIAVTWQSTLLASPLVLRAFGLRVPWRGMLFIALVMAGIVLVNLQSWRGGMSMQEVLLGVLPVFVAAFAYPIGNQMLNAARNGTSSRIAPITSPVLGDAASCVLLLVLGSVPFWVGLLAVVRPPAPTSSQVLQTLVVALSSGVIATTLFLRARNAAQDAYSIAAVDATQAGEVIFALAGEVLLLGMPLPASEALVGVFLVTGGIIGFAVGTPTKKDEPLRPRRTRNP